MTITGPSGRTYEMDGPKDDHQARHWERGVFYEKDLLDWCYANPQYFSRVLDVGASLGNHSVFFAGELSSAVLAVEPYTPAWCAKNLRANKITADILAYVVGPRGYYSAVPGPPGNVGMTRFRPDRLGVLHGGPLSRLAESFAPTAIKIDIEGAGPLYRSLAYVKRERPLLIIEETDADRLDLMDERLTLTHARLDRVFNATATYVWIPL